MKTTIMLNINDMRAFHSINGGKGGVDAVKIIANWCINVNDSCLITAQNFGLMSVDMDRIESPYIEQSEGNFERQYSLPKSRQKALESVHFPKALADYIHFKELVIEYSNASAAEVWAFQPHHTPVKRASKGVTMSSTRVGLDDTTAYAAMRIGDGNVSKGIRIALEWAIDRPQSLTTYEGLKYPRCVSLDAASIDNAKVIGSTIKSMGIRRAVYAYNETVFNK